MSIKIAVGYSEGGKNGMNRIKEMRMALNMQQKELAQAAGVSSPFIHDLENGNRNARPETMERIASALGCTVEALKGGHDDGATAQCG